MKEEVILNEESGQGTIEYALVLVILSILGIAAWRNVGQNILEMLTTVNNNFKY